MKKIVVGIGNDILGDDRTGLLVIEKLRDEELDVETDCFISHGLDVVQRILGYDVAVIVDSTNNIPPGEVIVLRDYELNGTMYSPHTLDIKTSIEILKRLGEKLPKIYFVLVGVEKIDYCEEISLSAMKGIYRAKEVVKSLILEVA